MTKLGTFTDAAAGIKFFYPMASHRKRFFKGKWVSSSDNSISSISLNQNIDDTKFTLDPSEARVIQDLDHDATIVVPH